MTMYIQCIELQILDISFTYNQREMFLSTTPDSHLTVDYVASTEQFYLLITLHMLL